MSAYRSQYGEARTLVSEVHNRQPKIYSLVGTFYGANGASPLGFNLNHICLSVKCELKQSCVIPGKMRRLFRAIESLFDRMEGGQSQKSFRAISLRSYNLKTMEKLIDRNIRY